jgi:hypothetical protein
MKQVTIYDPAMCCSTGICGAEVDQRLVTFAADLDWLKSNGVDVTRINLSQEPAAFAANDRVKSVLESAGVDGLPVILMGDEMHSSGRYPARSELAEMANVEYTANADNAVEESAGAGCCGSKSEAQDAPSGCC